MRSGLLARRLAAVAGGTAITAMVVLTASCAREEERPEEAHDDDHHHHAGQPGSGCTGCSGRADGEGSAHRSQPAEPLLPDGDRTAGADGTPWR
jgi:hypothetical protein